MLRYPLVTILIGFVVFVGLFGIAFVLLTQLIVSALGLQLDDNGDLPLSDPSLGWGQLLATLVLAPLALYAYRLIIMRWCEGRHFAPELGFNARARRWTPMGLALGAGVGMVYFDGPECLTGGDFGREPSAVAFGLSA